MIMMMMMTNSISVMIEIAEILIVFYVHSDIGIDIPSDGNDDIPFWPTLCIQTWWYCYYNYSMPYYILLCDQWYSVHCW